MFAAAAAAAAANCLLLTLPTSLLPHSPARRLLDILSRGDPYLLRFDAATTGEGLFNFLRWVAANHPTNSDPKRLMQLCASAWFEHLLNVTKEEIGDLVVLLDTAHHHDQNGLAGDGESKDAVGGGAGGA